MRIFIKKLTLFLKIYFYLRHLFPLFENGFYSIKREGKNYLIKKVKFSGFFIFSWHKKPDIFRECLLRITYVQHKFVFKIGGEVYSFYDNKSNWKTCFKNMEYFKEQSNYPINEFNLYSKWRMKQELFIQEDIQQTINYSKLLLFLLSLAIKANKIIDYHCSRYNFLDEDANNHIISYCQHGDTHAQNILISKGKFVFIDLDDIEIYPALYDFFRLMITDNESVIDFINGRYDLEISQVLNIEYNSNLVQQNKDLYFSLFILCFPDDISYVATMIPSCFYKSKKAFEYKKMIICSGL